MATQEKTWNVANRLHSQKDSDNPEVNHIIAGADEIYDDAKGAKQSDINAQTDSRLSTVESDINEPASGMKDRLTTLEEQVEFEGEIQVENDPAGIVSGSGKVATANAVRGAIDIRTGYYECDTAAETAAKVVNVPGFVLSVGGSIKIKMINTNTVDNATLNINSTGAKPLYYAGKRASAINTWEAGETVEVYYDGTNYYSNNVAGGSGSGDGAFDVSAKYPTSGVDGGNTYTLEGALAVLNANLLDSKKKGGMSIKFVQSSDNKYVQYRLIANSWSKNTYFWERYNDITTSNQSDSDLDFADEHGNVLVRFKEGHIKTKNFDSSKNSLSEADVAKVAGIEAGAEVNDVVTDDITDADLTFSDDAGNTVAMFKNGHIKTKEFDSSEDEFIRKYLRNKKIVFIGDSLTDTRASITPWYYLKFIEKTECMPYNRGWSGSTVATGYNSMCDRLDLPANDSQERAANHLGFPSTADIVIFFGGTNDWCRLKDQAYGDVLAPATKETFCGAVKYMITGLKNRYPQSDIIVLNLHHIYDRINAHNREVIYEDDDETKTATISVNNSGKSKEDYRKAIKECADMYGLPVVDMANVGFSAIMNTDNQLYYVDGIHLSELGGEVMANYLIKQLKTILSKH